MGQLSRWVGDACASLQRAAAALPGLRAAIDACSHQTAARTSVATLDLVQENRGASLEQ